MTRNAPQDGTTARPRIIVFAGPNGSGKTTITESLKRQAAFPATYINADDIARTELGHMPDLFERNLAAARLAEQRRKQALERGISFACETVLSTPGKLALFQQAKSNGFQVELVFITTCDAEINIARISNRAALGGHSVEPDKVRERYERAMRLLPSAVELADTFEAFDNSATQPMRVATKRGQTLVPVNADQAPLWVAKHLVNPWRERMDSRSRIVAAFRKAVAEMPESLKDADIRHGKSYAGFVLAVTKHHILQKVGASEYIVHDRALCPPVQLEEGKTARIAYQYERGGKHVELARNTRA